MVHPVHPVFRTGQRKNARMAFRVLEGIRRGLPEAGHLLDCLIDHALSGRTTTELPPLTVDEARAILQGES